MVAGIATLEGNLQDIQKKLEIDSETKIPQLFFTVYQHVFSSIYLISSILDTPYPPPDLLHPMQEKIQILPESVESEESQPQPEQQAEPAKTTEEPGTEEKPGEAETTEEATEEQSKPAEETVIPAEATASESVETATVKTT